LDKTIGSLSLAKAIIVLIVMKHTKLTNKYKKKSK